MTVTNYIWDEVNDNVLMETDEEGAVTAQYTQEPGLYGSVVSQDRDGDTSYYHFDGQGSTRQLTDESETVTDEATYSAFGVELSPPAVRLPWRYKGTVGYYAGAQGQPIYVRNRQLTPTTGRWMSQDPLSSLVIGTDDGVPGTQYAYSQNQPLTYVDPSGLVPLAPGTNVTAKCKPGSSCAGGRGSITASLDYGRRRLPQREGLLSSRFEAKFAPGPYAFWGLVNGASCCCCSDVAWLQIQNTRVKTGVPGVGRFHSTDGWELDQAASGTGVSYNDQSINPCRSFYDAGEKKYKVFGGSVSMRDFPGLSDRITKLAGVIYIVQSFHACVYCRTGVERGTIYGCVSWGHYFRTRLIDNLGQPFPRYYEVGRNISPHHESRKGVDILDHGQMSAVSVGPVTVKAACNQSIIDKVTQVVGAERLGHSH